jgi:glycosyltransferase involved in cell wall biosynthesis
MRKKTIGMLVYSNPDYYPPTVNAVHLLSEHFDVVLIGRNQEPSHWEYPSNVTVHRLGQYSSMQERAQASARSKLWEYINFVAQARRLLKEVSLIYAYDSFAYTAACLYQIALSESVPLIYQSHEISEYLSPLTSLSGWIQRAERAWIHKAAVVVLPDKDRAAFFHKASKLKEQPVVVPNFPRKNFFSLSSNWESLIPKRFANSQVLLQGAISPENSMLDLIKSITLVSNSIKLKFIGAIRESHQNLMKKSVEEHNIIDRFNYFTPVPYAELPLHTLSASVGICLYKKISLNQQANVTASNKIYEYAACGLPVIVSDFPNYREYLSGEPWVRFADPDDPQSIASAIQDILSDFETYKKMCLAARKAFENKFNYESAFFPILSNIKNILDDNSIASSNKYV